MLDGFDCYCKGESLKDKEKVKIKVGYKIVEMEVFRWFSRENYHFCYVLLGDRLKEYYYNQCFKPIPLENKTYNRVREILAKNNNLWIKCKNNERIKKVEGIFYDIYNEDLEIMDNTDFCRFSRNIIVKEIDIPRYVLISNLRIELFEKKLDEWMYLSTIETLSKKTNNFIILSTRGIFLKEFDFKEIRDDDIC